MGYRGNFGVGHRPAPRVSARRARGAWPIWGRRSESSTSTATVRKRVGAEIGGKGVGCDVTSPDAVEAALAEISDAVGVPGWW